MRTLESEGEGEEGQDDQEQTQYELQQARWEAADLEMAVIDSARKQLHRKQTPVSRALDNLLNKRTVFNESTDYC